MEVEKRNVTQISEPNSSQSFIPDEIEVTEVQKIKRISLWGWISSILEVYNLERGGLYTLVQLFYNPGKLVRAYLGVARYKIMSPFRVLILTTAAALLFFNYTSGGDAMMDALKKGVVQPNRPEIQEFMVAYNQFYLKYFNILIWSFIPFAAFFSWLFTKKSGLNFGENMVFQTFVSSIFNILFIPFLIIAEWSLTGAYIFYSLGFLMYLYAFKEFSQFSRWKAVLNGSLSIISTLIIWTVVLTPIITFIIIYQLKTAASAPV